MRCSICSDEGEDDSWVVPMTAAAAAANAAHNSKRPAAWPAVEPVLLDYLDHAPPNALMPARLEPPTAEIGKRGAEMLDDYIISGERPDSVLLPARFIPPARP